MKCPYCNNENSADAKFCEYCGKPLKDETSSIRDNRVIIHEEKKNKNSSYKNVVIVVLIAVIIILIVLYLYGEIGNVDENKVANNDVTQETKPNINADINLKPEVSNDISTSEDRNTTNKEVDEPKEPEKKEEPKRVEEPKRPVDKVEEYKVYRLNYEMLYRKEPNYKAKKLGYVKANKTVKIYETVESERGSIWGRLENGAWMCIKDTQYIYLTEEN